VGSLAWQCCHVHPSRHGLHGRGGGPDELHQPLQSARAPRALLPWPLTHSPLLAVPAVFSFPGNYAKMAGMIRDGWKSDAKLLVGVTLNHAYLYGYLNRGPAKMVSWRGAGRWTADGACWEGDGGTDLVLSGGRMDRRSARVGREWAVRRLGARHVSAGAG